MSTEKFEPFGEPLPGSEFGKQARLKASAILSAVGQSVFWLLVAVIVMARMAYFSPAPSFPSHVVSALTEHSESQAGRRSIR